MLKVKGAVEQINIGIKCSISQWNNTGFFCFVRCIVRFLRYLSGDLLKSFKALESPVAQKLLRIFRSFIRNQVRLK
jgi:hypothetical protein